MKKMKVIIWLWVIGAIFSLLAAQPLYANNAQVTNVAAGKPDLVNKTVPIEFDLKCDNAFGDATAFNGVSFSDYAWVFIKFYGSSINQAVGYWHGKLRPKSGLMGVDNSADPLIYEVGKYDSTTTGEGMPLGAQTEGMGFFIRTPAPNTTKHFKVILYWGANSNILLSDTLNIKVCAIEMVKIPQDSFVYNAGGVGGNSSGNYNSGTAKLINSPTLSPASNWPNGYSAFYIMKYEISQGEYADFLNMLSVDSAVRHFPGECVLSSTSGYAISYNSAAAYGSRYLASAPERACNYLSWDDAMAYASWCGLRPMTEMEFEKAARGGSASLAANARKYPWGFIEPGTDSYSYNDGSGDAIYNKYYTNYASGVPSLAARPYGVGHFLRGDTLDSVTQNYVIRTEAQTGASVYGVADLAGNLSEYVINCSWTNRPKNGDAVLYLEIGGVGDYTTLGWPSQYDPLLPAPHPLQSTRDGVGLRGGDFTSVISGTEIKELRISDRTNINFTQTGWDSLGSRDRNSCNNKGFRCVRTAADEE